jgi:hypothetical protein
MNRGVSGCRRAVVRGGARARGHTTERGRRPMLPYVQTNWIGLGRTENAQAVTRGRIESAQGAINGCTSSDAEEPHWRRKGDGILRGRHAV